MLDRAPPLKVARALGRRCIGYELERKYVELARKRLREPLHLRRQFIARFDKIAHAEIDPTVDCNK